MKKTQQSIAIVDDDESVLDALSNGLDSVSDSISTFSSPAKCLQSITFGSYDLLITDINMPEMDGVTLVNNARAIDPGLAILVMTGYATISLAVKTMTTGAEDFIEKPFSYSQVKDIVKKILDRQLNAGRHNFRVLTKTEKVVLSHIIEGYGNSGIANKLSRSIRTIEDHRSNLMRKLEVDNVVELVHKATAIGIYGNGSNVGDTTSSDRQHHFYSKTD